MSSELLPCPFCGEQPRQETYPTLTTVICDCVGLRVASWGPESTDKKGNRLNGVNDVWWCDAIRGKWNTRAATLPTVTPEILEDIIDRLAIIHFEHDEDLGIDNTAEIARALLAAYPNGWRTFPPQHNDQENE